MRSSKVLRLLVVLAVLSTLLIGCKSETKATSTSAPVVPTPTVKKVYTYKDMTVGFIQTGSEGGWRAANTASFKETAEQLGLNSEVLRCPEQAREPDLGFPQLHSDKDVNVIVLAALETTGWDEVLKEAKEAGKMVVLEDRRIDASEDLYATYIGSDFAEEGRKAADEMCKLLEGSAKKNVGRAGWQRRLFRRQRPRPGFPREDGRMRNHDHPEPDR